MTRQRLAQLAAAYDDFPAPEAELASGRVWSTEAVTAWKDKHLLRASGPRRRRVESGLFECFSDGLKSALASAAQEARELGHTFVGCPHLLLSLLRGAEPPLEQLGSVVGADLTALRDAVRAQVGRAARQSDGKFPFTPQAKEALNRGLRVAFLCRDDQVRSAHLLLGLLELREAGTVSVLNSAGVSSETLADVVQEILLKASAEAD